MLEEGRFAIRLSGMIDLDYGVGGLLGVDGNGNGHRQKRRGRRGSQTTARPGRVGRCYDVGAGGAAAWNEGACGRS